MSADNPQITLMVITDGRGDCIKRTLDSAADNLKGHLHHSFIVDDSADLKYHDWLQHTFPGFRIWSHAKRRGFAGAIQSGWGQIPNDTDYIFHLEDDFTFNEPINLGEIVTVMEANPYLA